MLIVGNDVVDLADGRTVGKASDVRFLKRIFNEEERAAIAVAASPDLELWLRWAAKETAYKAVSKLLGTPPTFAHRTFVVSLAPEDEGAGARRSRSGSVQYDSTIVHVEANWDPQTVHTVGWTGEAPLGVGGAGLNPRLERLDEAGAVWSFGRAQLEDRLTTRELEAVHSRASAAVRIAAREAIAENLAIDEARLQIVCSPGKPGRRPPFVLLDEEPSAVDVSLSHDGDWIAWAFALRPSARSAGS